MLNGAEAIKQWVVSGRWWWFGRRILGRPFVRHVGALTVANGVSAVISLASGLLVARWLGPELYGVAALVMSFPSLVYTFFDARSAEASVKYLSEFHARGERDRALAMCKVGYVADLGVAVLAFVGVLATAAWAASRIVDRPETSGLVLVYATAFLPRAFVGTSYAVMATLSRFSVIAFIDTTTTILRTALVLGLVLAGWQVAGVIWASALAMAATGLLYGAVAHVMVRQTWKGSWLRGDWHTLKGHRREILRFLAYNDVNALLGMIPKQLDVVLLGYFRGPTETGYYKLAKSLTGVVGNVVGPLQSVVYPELARLWGHGDRETLERRVRRLAWRAGVPLGLLTLVAVALIPFVLPRLVGSAYRPATVAIQIFLCGAAIWLALFWLRPMYLAQGRMHQWFVISTKVVVPTLVAYPLIIWQWGYVGLAVWSVAMQFIAYGLAAYGIWREQREQ
jgi:O-antigen/teichoic acid export membrane protein